MTHQYELQQRRLPSGKTRLPFNEVLMSLQGNPQGIVMGPDSNQAKDAFSKALIYGI
jgi:hypothetical protein